MIITILKYIFQGIILIVSAGASIWPHRFRFPERRLSIACSILTAIVLVLSITDDIRAARNARQQTEQFEKRIAAAEEAAKPLPLTTRLRTLLNEIDSRILPAINEGKTGFEGGITASQYTRLQTIANEHSAHQLIRIDPASVRMGVGMGTEGVTYNVAFTIDKKVLSDN